jgi:hypothetical protein
MGSKRFLTYFDIPLPPFKEKKLGAGSVTIRFVLKGKIPSKKNRVTSVAVRKDAKDYINSLPDNISKGDAIRAINKVYSKVVGNIEFKEWVDKQRPVLISQAAKWSERLADKGLIFPLPKAALSLRFYFNNRYITDTVNKQQSVQDLLITAGIIANDDYNSLNPIYSASACYVDELVDSLVCISLSFRL